MEKNVNKKAYPDFFNTLTVPSLRCVDYPNMRVLSLNVSEFRYFNLFIYLGTGGI